MDSVGKKWRPKWMRPVGGRRLIMEERSSGVDWVMELGDGVVEEEPKKGQEVDKTSEITDFFLRRVRFIAMNCCPFCGAARQLDRRGRMWFRCWCDERMVGERRNITGEKADRLVSWY